ncbi:MAG: YihA family ribosome biogenesis GTP-binding protein, partial [Clostridiales bacterium]|nr:YihA family ribosome biogenesis GTP-binding protein [Clostridiales bacterium]
YGLDGVVVATKSDKISSNDKQKNISTIRKVLELKKDDILIAASSVSRQGHDEIWNLIETLITEN